MGLQLLSIPGNVFVPWYDHPNEQGFNTVVAIRLLPWFFDDLFFGAGS